MKPQRGDWDYSYYSHITGELWFPKPEKTYLQIACYEWENEKEEVKLGDLGYLVTHGFDLPKFIRTYKKERPREKCYIENAILEHLGYLRLGVETMEPYLFRLLQMRKVTFPQLVKLLVTELTLRYEERYEHLYAGLSDTRVARMKPMPLWDFEAQASKHQWTKEEMISILKLPTDEYLKLIQIK